MIIFDWTANNGQTQQRRKILALFGVGLIGGAIQQSVTSRYRPAAQYLPFSWRDFDRQITELSAIRSRITGICEQHPDSATDIHVVYSGGQAGFSGPAEQLEEEQRSFNKVLGFAASLGDAGPAVLHHFHLFSSAGGLFENQRFVDRTRKPEPLRPYGYAKLEQETALKLCPDEMSKWVYRPSSVYGFGGPGKRAGLVALLMKNAILHKPAVIFGRPNTLRDYVLSDDIGQFVAARIAGQHVGSEQFILASGKATCITEILAIIERTVERRLYLRYATQVENADHITFLPEVFPAGWKPTNLESGIRRVATQIKAGDFS